MKNGNQKTQKTPIKYHCKNVTSTSNKKDFNRHLLTRKHKKTQKWEKSNVEFCNFCDKG